MKFRKIMEGRCSDCGKKLDKETEKIRKALGADKTIYRDCVKKIAGKHYYAPFSFASLRRMIEAGRKWRASEARKKKKDT